MGGTVPKPLGQLQLEATTATPIYTCPAGKQGIVASITLCNTHNAALTFTLHKVPSGGSAAADNMLYDAAPIGAGETQVDDTPRALAPGDFIVGLSSMAAKITVTIDGAEHS